MVTAGALVWAWGLAGTGVGFWGSFSFVAKGGMLASTVCVTKAIVIGALSGFVGGFVATGSLKGALFGALSGAVAAGIGQWAGRWSGRLVELRRAMAHGISQGALAEAQGGRYAAGFLAGGFGSLASHYELDLGSANVVKAAVIGGTASTLGGGKFENGAVTAAFTHVLNNGLSDMAQRAKWSGDLSGRDRIAMAREELSRVDSEESRLALRVMDESVILLTGNLRNPEGGIVYGYTPPPGAEKFTFAVNYDQPFEDFVSTIVHETRHVYQNEIGLAGRIVREINAYTWEESFRINAGYSPILSQPFSTRQIGIFARPPELYYTPANIWLLNH